MNTARESNIKSVVVISLVSFLLFGIFYYLITDVSNSSSSDLKASSEKVTEHVMAQNFVSEQKTDSSVKGASVEASVFKELSTQKADVQPKMVLGGSSEQTTQSTVPSTGSETGIFGAFVVSSLVMFTGIYLLLTQPKNRALAKFERRIIRELD